MTGWPLAMTVARIKQNGARRVPMQTFKAGVAPVRISLTSSNFQGSSSDLIFGQPVPV